LEAQQVASTRPKAGRRDPTTALCRQLLIGQLHQRDLIALARKAAHAATNIVAAVGREALGECVTTR